MSRADGASARRGPRQMVWEPASIVLHRPQTSSKTVKNQPAESITFLWCREIPDGGEQHGESENTPCCARLKTCATRRANWEPVFVPSAPSRKAQ
jgi:hypothetical protein